MQISYTKLAATHFHKISFKMWKTNTYIFERTPLAKVDSYSVRLLPRFTVTWPPRLSDVAPAWTADLHSTEVCGRRERWSLFRHVFDKKHSTIQLFLMKSAALTSL